MKEENLQLKELAKKKEEEARVIPEVIPKRKAPIRQRPKKQEVEYQQPIQQQPKPSTDYLLNQSYAEQLQTRLRDNMIQNAMRNTFM